jgi:prepilin-type N-terminal cleavage/methylation domain-containing protein
MLSKLQKSNKGFTIIEVMIVLAIAALILLIVLLAVPALQRNSRNTAIKNDASAVVSGVSEYTSNNDGQIPDSNSSYANGTVTLYGGSGTSKADVKVQGSDTVDFSGDPGSDTGHITVLFGKKCQADNDFGVDDAARSTAVLYNIESSSGPEPRCVGS